MNKSSNEILAPSSDALTLREVLDRELPSILEMPIADSGVSLLYRERQGRDSYIVPPAEPGTA